jgi:hypothetical protein
VGRRTEPALKPAALNEALLDGIKTLFRCKSLDRAHHSLIEQTDHLEASRNTAAIDLNCAGTAVPDSTAVLRPGKSQVTAQQIQ